MMDLLFSARGRVGRGQFWKGVIVLTLVAIALSVALNVVLGLLIPNQSGEEGQFSVDGLAALPFIFGNLAIVVPMMWSSVCLGIKRYHDRGKSGLWVLISLVPFIGGIWYFIETGFLRGTAGPNAYGPDPLGGVPASYGYAAA